MNRKEQQPYKKENNHVLKNYIKMQERKKRKNKVHSKQQKKKGMT